MRRKSEHPATGTMRLKMLRHAGSVDYLQDATASTGLCPEETSTLDKLEEYVINCKDRTWSRTPDISWDVLFCSILLGVSGAICRVGFGKLTIYNCRTWTIASLWETADGTGVLTPPIHPPSLSRRPSIEYLVLQISYTWFYSLLKSSLTSKVLLLLEEPSYPWKKRH